MTDEPYPDGFDTDSTSPGFVPGEEVEVVPLDEPSIEDYPFKAVSRCWCVGAECVGADKIPEDEFCFQDRQKQPTVQDGVRDTRNR